MASSFALGDDPFDVRSLELANGREIGPLIGVRNELIVNEDTVATFTSMFLQRQRDKVAESAMRQGVLARKKPVVRFKSHVRMSFHRVVQHVRSEPARQCGRNRFVEEEPHVPTTAGA